MTQSRNVKAAIAIAALSLPLMYGLLHVVDGVFARMAVFYAVATPACLLAVKLDWKKLLRDLPRMAGLGLALALVLYCFAWVGFGLIRRVFPEFAAQSHEFYGWMRDDGSLVMWLLILFVIVGEEIVWRVAVTLPLVEKWKHWGVLAGAAGFAAMHLPWGPPLLILAAFVFGGCWSFIIWRTQSLWCSLASHLLWDAMVMWIAPLA
ncbi:MAG: CPBP family intramembrane metalloprotease [Planctomycetes bacterium]|nr:CPBP family intramembrane metalloprotease [Planctomycetota bacterium]